MLRSCGGEQKHPLQPMFLYQQCLFFMVTDELAARAPRTWFFWDPFIAVREQLTGVRRTRTKTRGNPPPKINPRQEGFSVLVNKLFGPPARPHLLTLAWTKGQEELLGRKWSQSTAVGKFVISPVTQNATYHLLINTSLCGNSSVHVSHEVLICYDRLFWCSFLCLMLHLLLPFIVLYWNSSFMKYTDTIQCKDPKKKKKQHYFFTVYTPDNKYWNPLLVLIFNIFSSYHYQCFYPIT